MRHPLFIAMFLSIATCYGQTQIFSDVPTTSNYYVSSANLYNLGITAGCNLSPFEFCPTSSILRREVAIFLVRAWSIALYNGPENFKTVNPPSGTAHFTDEPTTDTDYYPYVQKLWELGITGGCGTNTFCPTDDLENFQMAIFAARMRYVIDHACTSVCSPNDDGFTYTTTSAYFADVSSSYSYFKWIQRMADLGAVTNSIDAPGCSPVGYFCPTANIDRGDAANYIYWGGLTGAQTVSRGGSDFNWYNVSV